MRTVGRERERRLIGRCLAAGRHVILEGPVGSGKTFLAEAVARDSGAPLIRVDGDGRYSEAKLSGAFDPALTLKHGYIKEAFREGPLARALREGAILLLNELNRFPEGTQNLLLPVLDEGRIDLPGIGTLEAHPRFRVIATQNPAEFVATSPLSEALLDRLERIAVDYPSQEEEHAILREAFGESLDAARAASILTGVMRATREHPAIRRGASLRAGVAAGKIALHALLSKEAKDLESALRAALLPAFSGRIEFERGTERTVESVLEEILSAAIQGAKRPSPAKKKT